MKIHWKELAVATLIATSLSALTAAAVTDIKFSFGTNGAGQSVIYPSVNAILGVPMSQGYVASAVATTTAGTLATSSVVTYNFSNVAAGTLATSSVPLKYYFEIGATDVNGGASLPSGELSAGVSSTNANNEVVVSWPAMPGAAYYDLYIGTSSQGEALQATTTALTFTLSTTTATSSTGISAVTPPTVNYAYTDTINPNGKSYFGGDVQVYHLNGNNVAIVATGTAAGTGATTSIAYATDLSGVVTLHTGTAAMGTSSVLFKVTYGEAYTKAPACVLFPENATSAAITSGATPYMIPGTTSTQAEANSTALATSTTYVFGWVCSN